MSEPVLIEHRGDVLAKSASIAGLADALSGFLPVPHENAVFRDCDGMNGPSLPGQPETLITRRVADGR